MSGSSSEKTAAKRAAAKSEPRETNPRLELAKAIHTLTQKMEAFTKGAEGLASFTKDHLVEFDIQLEAKRSELEALALQYEQAKKRGRTEIDLYLAEERYEGAKKILVDRDEVPVATSELDKMRTNLKTLAETREKELADAIAKKKASHDKAQAAALNMQRLKHEADTALLSAQKDQQAREIAALNTTIANLKDEVAQQRKLTEAVANAARSGPITVSTAGK